MGGQYCKIWLQQVDLHLHHPHVSDVGREASSEAFAFSGAGNAENRHLH